METHLVANDGTIDQFLSSFDFSKQSWMQLEQLINLFQNNFVKQLRRDYTCLSEDDIRIILLIRIKCTNKEIARMENILLKSFRMRRWRIRQKMGITCDSFTEFIQELYQ